MKQTQFFRALTRVMTPDPRVGPGFRFQISRVGSDREIFKLSRIGPGYPSSRPDPT